MKKILITLLTLAAAAVLVLLAGFVGQGGKGADAADGESEHVVRKTSLLITVTEKGHLKATDSVNIVPQFRRQGTILSLIDEGKSVQEGEILVEFDKTEVQTQIDELENQLIQYETELDAARASLEIQEKDNDSQVKAAEVALERARLELERYEQGEGPNEHRTKKLDVERAESEFTRARDKYEQVPDLLEKGYLTQDQAEEERFRLRESEINLENRKSELTLFETYTRPMEIARLHSEHETKERDLARTQETAQINVKEKQARITQHERQVQSTRDRLTKHRKEHEQMTMKAPKPGIVLYGDPSRPWEKDRIKVGNQVYSGMTVLTIPDLTSMQCLIQIHEADINHIAMGQACTLTIDTHKGQTFTGKVARVAQVATSNWDSGPDNRRFEVVVDLDSLEGVEIRSGVSARVQIHVDEVKDVLTVPLHAVHADAGEHFCFVSKGGAIERRAVKVGRNNDHFVILLEGVAAGEAVLLYDPRDENKGTREGTGRTPGGDGEGGGTAIPSLDMSS
jgi:HlyD family secretion protein